MASQSKIKAFLNVLAPFANSKSKRLALLLLFAFLIYQFTQKRLNQSINNEAPSPSPQPQPNIYEQKEEKESSSIDEKQREAPIYESSLTDIVNMEEINTKLHVLEEENHSLLKKIDDLEICNKTANKQIKLTKQRMIETITEYQRLEEENNELQQEIDDIGKHNDALQEENGSFKIQMQTANQYENIVNKLQLEMEETNNKYSDYDQLLSAIEKYKSEQQQFSEKIMKNETELDRLKQINENILTAHDDELDKIKQQFGEKMIKNSEELEMQRKSGLIESDKLRQTIQDLENENDILQTGNDELNGERKSLQNEVDALKEENEAKMARFEEKILQNNAELDTLKQEHKNNEIEHEAKIKQFEKKMIENNAEKAMANEEMKLFRSEFEGLLAEKNQSETNTMDYCTQKSFQTEIDCEIERKHSEKNVRRTSPNEVEIKNVFRQLDVDKSGFIDRDKVKKGFELLGHDVAGLNVLKIMGNDTDGLGENEFCVELKKYAEGGKLYEKVDVTDDGSSYHFNIAVFLVVFSMIFSLLLYIP